MINIHECNFSFNGFYYIRIIGKQIKHYRFETRGGIQLLNKTVINKKEYERVENMLK